MTSPSVARVALCVAVAATLAASSGCGEEGVSLHDISGSATFDGQPIVYGYIEFIPDPNKENPGPAGFADIVDGKYSTSESGRGVVVGPHIVRVTAYSARPPESEVQDELAAEDAEGPEVLFAGYQLELDLTEAEHDIVVPADAAGFDAGAVTAGEGGGGDVP